ncbi:autotransporter domain-containing protein, partial [Leptotrichia sp. OH3620_COT-345]|uniref:autotransporter domain-containing protein n=1 Tax=Leptotrichia sp. OH3620_COT-345 TaxID=2491048 RepID=UPI0013151D1B
PWSSWQFGMNYFYSNWRGAYKGRGDKKEKYPYEGVFKRGEWWERNVSPDSVVYDRLQLSTDPLSSLSNKRNGLNYGLVTTRKVKDAGVPFIIEPVINISTPPLPNLNINPVIVNPNVKFTIPDVTTVTFTPTTLPDINPNVFDPPALDEVSIGFAQDMQGISFYAEPNVIINNANANANAAGTTVLVTDTGFNVDNSFTWDGKKENQGRSSTGTGTVVGTWNWTQSNPDPSAATPVPGNVIANSAGVYAAYKGNAAYRNPAIASSPQTVFSFTQYQQPTKDVKPGNVLETTLTGNWTLKNATTNPNERGKVPRNTLRFISVNGNTVYSFYDPLVVNFNGKLNLYGRSLENSLSTGKPHMTVGVEYQTAGAHPSIFKNNGEINLEREDAKNAAQLGIYLIGMTAMVEDYAQYQPNDGNEVGKRNGISYPKITYKPWASEMQNNGTITVKSIDSIGMDFSEFHFHPTAQIGANAVKQKAWDNKGSLNVYMKVGNINVTSEGISAGGTTRGSYGIRVPNVFAPNIYKPGSNRNPDTEAIYYDETIINGDGGKVTLEGSYNTGISISKLIRGAGLLPVTNPYTETTQVGSTEGDVKVGEGHKRVYDYQKEKGTNLDNTGRTVDDPIGNIFNLNILVGGRENVGFLRKSDYMKGGYSAAAQALAQKDFVIRDTHVKSIDFTGTADGGVLFRTDRYGIDVHKNLTVTPGNASSADKRFNIVLLANGSINHADAIAPKVKNTGTVTVNAGGQNVIGLMAYQGGNAESAGDLTISGSDDSIGMVINGINASNKKSMGTSSGNISVTGKRTAGIYNNGSVYSMTGGSVKVNGEKAIAIYASAVGNRLAETILGAGTVEAQGTGSVALYANGGSDITLNGTTLKVGNGGLMFYGEGIPGNHSQLLLTGNATAHIGTGGTAFYVKAGAGSPLENIRSSASTGTLTVNLANGSTFLIAEGNGGNVGGEKVSSLRAGSGGSVPGIVINGTPGQYIPYKASRVPLTVDVHSNLDNVADAYLNSEFSSSSITVEAGKSITGSGILTAPAKLVGKSKVAIAQKNTQSPNRNDVILTNNGTINLTGKEMAGIVGEFAEIINNSVLNTTGDDSTAIISANGSVAKNDGTITIGNGGVGIAGINYLGVTENPPLGIPTYGNQSIELRHNGSIVSNGTSKSAIGILAVDLAQNSAGTLINASNSSRIYLGNGSSIDVSSAAGGIGVYSKGVYRNGSMAKVNDDGSIIKIGSNGIGYYLEGTELDSGGGSIETVGGTTGKGIFTDSNVINNKNITLMGDKSIGIHNYGANAQYGPGVLVAINNGGTITLGNSADRNNPSIGIFTKNGNINHQGNIIAGMRGLGILSETLGGVLSSGNIAVGEEGLGIYKKKGSLTVSGGISTGNSAVAVYGDDNVSIVNNSPNITVGDNSFGFAILSNGINNYTGNAGSNFSMGTRSVYLYKSGANGAVNSATNVNSTGISSTGFYATNGAVINNTGNVNFGNSTGSVGAYASNNGSVNHNGGSITVGQSDIKNKYYAIGMAAQKGGKIYNSSVINVTGNYGIGMFAEGIGTVAENHGTINLISAGELKGAYGMYLNNGAYGVNAGTIISGRYSGDANKEASYGVAVLNGATLENRGTIDIDMDNSYGIYIKGGIIKNYGTINISGTGSVGIRNKNGKDANGNPITDASMAGAGVNTRNGANAYVDESGAGSQPSIAGSTIISPSGVATIDGKVVPLHDLTPGPNPKTGNFAFSNVGIYIDTLGRTNPINWVDGFVPNTDNDLIIGSEAAELSNSKAIKIGKNIITPYIAPYQSLGGGTGGKLNAISGSLTWTVQPIEGASGFPEEAIMAKIPYTDFVAKTENAWNFADGLEQRYGVEAIGTREKQLFNKLNSIGKNEQVLLTQAYDEMMGHQYANTQQRIYGTGRLLDKEFTHLKKEWDNKSKQSNKIKTFGIRDEYKTDTAGVIDYTSNAYGVAYVHEDETIKLGNSTGWYAGAVHNRFSFKDIGRSKENTTMLKIGVFKSKAFDHNGSLNWTISGEGYVSRSDMHRKFL